MMIKCPNCGYQNSEYNAFCSNCKKRLFDAKCYCPNCDITHSDGEESCTKCGGMLWSTVQGKLYRSRKIKEGDGKGVIYVHYLDELEYVYTYKDGKKSTIVSDSLSSLRWKAKEKGMPWQEKDIRYSKNSYRTKAAIQDLERNKKFMKK